MVGCDKCSSWFTSERALNIHKGRVHSSSAPIYAPDLVRMGVMKRKLTKKESAQVTREVLAMNLHLAEARFTMAIIKAIDIVQHNEVRRD